MASGSILQFLGGRTADVVEVDVVCTGRFSDFCARHEGARKIVRRQPIYEKDRLDVRSGWPVPAPQAIPTDPKERSACNAQKTPSRDA